ncbi:MAG TPA: arsenate reductase ArsC, partial [Thermoanaerobaculia bacterium]|nr:arsenate reductase ArsC [Thermoanaerobaculia bacterium]
AVKKVFGLDMDGQRPKSMNDFVSQKFDYVITVCDRAAESCPTFPGALAVIRWSLPDPAEAQGTEQEKLRAFENGAKDLMQRIRLWLALPAIARRIPSAPGRDRG